MCANYKSNTGSCTIHFIREVTLYQLVLQHLRRVLCHVKHYESDFVQTVSRKSTEEQTKAMADKRRALAQGERRMVELDALFQRLYEDNVAQRISDERFAKMSAAYEEEQTALAQMVAALEAELVAERQRVANTERFLALVRRYTRRTDPAASANRRWRFTTTPSGCLMCRRRAR